MIHIIGAYLSEEGHGTVGQDIFFGMMPDKPDECFSLFEYAGSPPDLHWNGEYPGLQIRTRGKTYQAGKNKAKEISKTLHGLNEITLEGVRFLLFKAKGSPEVLKRDESGRTEWIVNFDIIKESE